MRIRNLVPTFVVLVVAAVGFHRSRATISSLVASRDAARRSYERNVRMHAEVVQAGELMPASLVRTSNGRRVPLDSLIGEGARYFYFYRDDCKACQTIGPVVEQMPETLRKHTVFIHYGFTKQLKAIDSPRHFAWMVDTAARRIVGSVPSLLVVNHTGRVVSTADFDTRRVVQLLDLYGLARQTALDSAIALANFERVADTLERTPRR